MIVAARQRLLVSQGRQSVLGTAAKSISQTNTLPLRWHSSIETKQCPCNGGGNNNDSATSIDKVKLVKVPKLPFIGSIISQHSGMDKVDLSKSYDTWYNNHKSFGHFYSAGLPAVGKGLCNEGECIESSVYDIQGSDLLGFGDLPFGPLLHLTCVPSFRYQNSICTDRS